MTTEEKQKLMLEALSETFFNITASCKMVGIDRQTHYNWVGKFDHYKKACEEIENSFINIAESQLKKNINEGKETSLIFFLKCKGGYKEHVEFSTPEAIEINVNRIG